MLWSRGLSLFQFGPGNAALALLRHIRQNSRFFFLAQQIAEHFALNAFPAVRQYSLDFGCKFFTCADGCHGGFGISVSFANSTEQPCNDQPQNTPFPGG